MVSQDRAFKILSIVPYLRCWYIGEDKGKERCLGCSSRYFSYAMLGFSPVMNKHGDIHAWRVCVAQCFC